MNTAIKPMTKAVERVRVEIVIDGVTYVAELRHTNFGNMSASLELEHETVRQPDPTETWWEHHPTGNARIRLEAFGKLVRSGRAESAIREAYGRGRDDEAAGNPIPTEMGA